METTKSGFVTLVGRPNVGKSTLMNHLIGQKIAITSNKPQTTRNRIHTVYTDERGQIVFVDTPGIHQAKNKLGEFMVNAAMKTFSEVDVILWLVEPSNYIGAGDQNIAKELKRVKCPVILIINKTDTVPKEKIGTVIKAYRELMDFTDVIAVSALRSVNMDQVIDAIMRCLPYGPMFYDEDTVTDQPMRQICAEMVREKALRLLADEIPHGIAVTIEKMTERDDGLFDIEANIVCERETHKQIIIGKGGSMIKKIGSTARFDMEKMLEARVNLKLWVKVRKEWRDNELYLKNYGYTKDL
ncbi:MAG: GTPase Era [Lachnospiraceae bacterium]|nr:GTPase Era [Lachnospiraceae bacterium]